MEELPTEQKEPKISLKEELGILEKQKFELIIKHLLEGTDKGKRIKVTKESFLNWKFTLNIGFMVAGLGALATIIYLSVSMLQDFRASVEIMESKVDKLELVDQKFTDLRAEITNAKSDLVDRLHKLDTKKADKKPQK